MEDTSLDVHVSAATLPTAEWNDLVERSRLGSVFHRTEWLRAVEAGTGMRPRHLVAVRDGRLVGLLPGFVADVDLPLSPPGPLGRLAPRELVSTQPGFGGPLATTDERAVTDRLLGGVRRTADSDVWAHRVRTLDPGHARQATVLDERGYVPSTLTCQLVVDLDRPTDDLLADVDTERRRLARRAREDGITVTAVDPDPATMDAFYDDYAAMIDRVDGVRFSPGFLHALADHLGDRLHLLRADREGEAVGWHLYLADDERDELHHFFSGVPDGVSPHPSSLLHEEGLQWANEAGYATYNFGESNADPGDGGFANKHQYGGRVLPVLTWEAGLTRARWSAFRLARRGYRVLQARR